ncbi:MAG: Nitroreductase [Akkermansiaceae bacterium]|nr:Nitroreductase [Akkermansiaceae bacterium]
MCAARMEIDETIRQRRTVKNFTPEPVPRELLEQVLEAGLWAQNHGMTEPWRFTLLGPETREALAKMYEHSRHKIMNPRELVVVSQVLSNDENVRREDYAAVSCAIQNIALAAWSKGLGLLWSTGKWTRLAETYPGIGLDPAREDIVAFLNFGFPDGTPSAPPRKPLAEVLTVLP